MEEKNCRVKPIIVNDRLKCPICGTGGMRLNRGKCSDCGAEFLQELWECTECGKINQTSSDECEYCHIGVRSNIIQNDLTKNTADTNKALDNGYAASENATSSRGKFTMKWYYFVLYGFLISGIIEGFVTGIATLAVGRIPMGLISIALAVYAIVVHIFLKKYKSFAITAWLGYLGLNYGISIVDGFIQCSRGATGLVGKAYVFTIIISAIAALIMIPGNAAYFGVRRELFVN